MTFPVIDSSSFATLDDKNISYLVDFIELMALVNDASVAQDEIEELVRELNNTYDSDESIAMQVDDIFMKLEFRVYSYGKNPPYSVSRRELVPNVTPTTRPDYCAMLLFSTFGNGNIPKESSDSGGKVFEEICKVALKNIFGHEVYYFADKSNKHAIENLAASINEIFLSEKSNSSGDRGNDLMVTIPFAGDRGNFHNLIFQCASGKNWVGKINDFSPSEWNAYINFIAPPTKGFCIPYYLEKDRGMSITSFDWVSRRLGGLLLDRTRIYEYFDTSMFESETQTRVKNWITNKLGYHFQ